MKWRWILPPVLLAGLIALLLSINPAQLLNLNAPPLESLTVERTVLNHDGMTLQVRAEGSEPMKIAQVQVDGAYWEFDQQPPGAIRRLATATVQIPYPWVEGEAHHVVFLTNTGVTIDHLIEVALPTPGFSLSTLLGYGWLGLYVGLVPVSLGMLCYPYLKVLRQRGLMFMLTLTLGMLAFLLVDTLQEGLELATEAAIAFQGQALVWLAATVAFLALLAVGRRRGKSPEGTALSTYMALGIGLHNLGEGLAIGTAFALGEIALGSFLVVGFTLHNLTEGLGIVAPLLKYKLRWTTFLSLAALAGLPAVVGIWVGAFAFSPHWAALFLGIGAGAILQVIVEVGTYLQRRLSQPDGSELSSLGIAGFTIGLMVMYGTAFLVKF
ncbi:metal transporter [Nodosilinea sp. LEGE 07088]|uniref:ZIP family metal transporter n=1 Tax=Nodosilinea sp. LEGE 07088 TaxID=2777968 RepID=UPI0018818B7E|nr:metal transporter [Nodosilinea sp. LEGE 07088]MBE9135646.1 metal transporter [Nodosilinea sp. LEGE 07088]